jgi:hypothetical protein
MRRREHQSGFGATGVILVVLAVAILASTGLMIYQHHKSGSAKNSAATSQTQTTTQPQNTTSTQPAQATTQYLTIKEWGVKLPLSANIKDAYYTTEGSNTGADGLPNTVWLGKTSFNSNGCNIANTGPSSKATPIGSILRVLLTDRDPVTGDLYTQKYPNGVTIGNYYYAYAPWKHKSCAPTATLQSVDSEFATAAKSTGKANAAAN